MSELVERASVSELRRAIVSIYGGQSANTTVGDDGLVEYEWGGAGLPKIQTKAGSDVFSRVLTNRSGTNYQGAKVDTDTWSTSANKDAEFEVSGVYPGYSSSAPRFIDALRAQLKRAGGPSSSSTRDTTSATTGPRSWRETATVTPAELNDRGEMLAGLKQNLSSSSSSRVTDHTLSRREKVGLAVGLLAVGYGLVKS